MYKNFNITESEKEQILNRLKENGYRQPTNKKVISEQPEGDGDYQNEFNMAYKVMGHDNLIMVTKDNRRDRFWGLLDRSNMKFVLHPNYEMTNLDNINVADEEKLAMEFTNPNGKKFYAILTQTHHKHDTVEIFSEEQFHELGHVIQPINEDVELDESSDEKYFAKHDKSPMGWTGSSNKLYKDLPDGDYDDESYDDFDTLHNTHPDFHKHYSGKRGEPNDAKSMFGFEKEKHGPLRIKRKRQMENPLNEGKEILKDVFKKLIK